MFVTEASVSATSELTLQIDISMPNLATSQPDLSFSGTGLTPRARNNKYYSSNLRRNDRLTGSDIGLNNGRTKKPNTGQKIYHRRCMAEDATSSDRSHGDSDPALSPSTSHDSSQHKKPFITVVKSGKFLDPPNDNYKQHHHQQVLVYSYCSKPRAMPPTYKHRKSKDNINSNNNNNNLNNNNNNNNNNNEYKNHNNYSHTYYHTTNKQLLQTYNTRNKRSTEIYQQQDGGTNPYGNIMYDKRVVRGSNFAQHPNNTPAERQEEARRRAAARRRARPNKAFRRLGTPPPVDGRRHTDVQTEGYLEEILDRPREVEVCCQTEPAWDQPPPPPYEAPKTGVDQDTQIYPGDLFDFECASQPVVGQVVSRALEQALAEVLQEEEVAGLRAQQRRLHELRLAEWAEARRVNERESRLEREKERRTREHESAALEQRRVEERAAAAALSQAMLEDMLPSVLAGLAEAGQIPESMQREVEPWLVEEVAQEMKQMITSRHVLTDIVREVLETRAELRRALGDEVVEDDDEAAEEEPKSEEQSPEEAQS